MSSLDNLQKKLYRPSLENELEKRLAYQYQEPEDMPPRKDSFWEKFQALISKKSFKLVAGLLGVVILSGFILNWLRGESSFDPGRVTLAIVGPQKIESGEFLKYDFVISNKNELSLSHAKLIITYPEGANLQNPEKDFNRSEIDLGNIKGPQEKKVSSYVKIFGAENSTQEIRAEIEYFPTRLSSILRLETKIFVDIISFPVKLVIDEPKITALYKDLVYTVSYSNRADDAFQDLRLKIIYPEGFQPKEFSQKPDIFNNIWEIKNLEPNKDGDIKITGQLTHPLDSIFFEALLELKSPASGNYETFAQARSVIPITPSPISLEVKALNLASQPDIVNPGQKLRFQIDFQNITDSILRDIDLVFQLRPSHWWETKNIMPSDNGIYLPEEQKIIWDGRRINALALLGPFESGRATVDVELKKAFFPQSYKEKNFIVEVFSSIRPKAAPPELSGIDLESEASLVLKIGSFFILKTKLLGEDESPIGISGPRPPQLGQKTTYAAAWQLLNYYNDLENIIVKAYLPQGIEWAGEWWPRDAKINFDYLTGELTWEIASLKAGTGFVSPVTQVVFKLGLIPSPSQAGGRVNLVTAPSAQGTDIFTNQTLVTDGETIISQ